ncbi:MAG TPA: SDR family NAD(P)-dependent oxidoreductase [Blastocatellia bacterium]|nr:SDR family NAD(P)-dependent oxidoreductase [Blastocatellia bacterium]
MGKLGRQIVIITGASAGIGAATARRLAGAGARVVLSARRYDRLEALKLEIEAAGGSAMIVPGDVTSPQDRAWLVSEAVREYGRIDALVNNAGFGQRGPIEMVPVDNIRANFETNLFSLIALTQLVIPIMRKQHSGRIVNISSVAGRIARPLSSVYDATKHALEAVSDGLRGELAPFGIQVVVIEPGFILTEFLEAANEVSKPVLENAGPYAPFFADYQQTAQRGMRIAGKPEDISELVVRALAAKRPRIRYAAPRHANIALFLKRVLPERLFDYVLNRMMNISAERLASAPVEGEKGRKPGERQGTT